jgi:hypothetical protein
MGQVVPFNRKAGTPDKASASKVVSRPVAAFYADREGRFDFVNADWCRLTNCNQAQAFGDGWLDTVHPDDRLHVARQWRDTIRDEKFLSIAFRLARSWPLHVAFQALPQYDHKGDCTGYSGTLTALETTNSYLRTLAPQSLSLLKPKDAATKTPEIGAREQRLRDAIDLAGLYYFEHDLIAGTTYRSKPLRQLFGGNRNVAELTAAIHPEDSPKFWYTHNRAQVDKVPWVNEFRVTFSGCETLHVKSQGLFSHDRAGEPTVISGFTMPIAAWNANLNSSAVELLHKISSSPV